MSCGCNCSHCKCCNCDCCIGFTYSAYSAPKFTSCCLVPVIPVLPLASWTFTLCWASFVDGDQGLVGTVTSFVRIYTLQANGVLKTADYDLLGNPITIVVPGPTGFNWVRLCVVGLEPAVSPPIQTFSNGWVQILCWVHFTDPENSSVTQFMRIFTLTSIGGTSTMDYDFAGNMIVVTEGGDTGLDAVSLCPAAGSGNPP